MPYRHKIYGEEITDKQFSKLDIDEKSKYIYVDEGDYESGIEDTEEDYEGYDPDNDPLLDNDDLEDN